MIARAHELQSSLSEGCRLPVRMHGTDDWPLAEIISIRDVQGKNMYYVHYVDCKCACRISHFKFKTKFRL